MNDGKKPRPSDLNRKRDPGRAVDPDARLKGEGMQDKMAPTPELAREGNLAPEEESPLDVDEEMDETAVGNSAEQEGGQFRRDEGDEEEERSA